MKREHIGLILLFAPIALVLAAAVLVVPVVLWRAGHPVAAVVTFLLLGSMVTGAAIVGHEEDEQ